MYVNITSHGHHNVITPANKEEEESGGELYLS